MTTMPDEFGPTDISNQGRAFSVDDVLEAQLPERSEAPDLADDSELLENIEALIRLKHQQAGDVITRLVNERVEINALIKLARQDLAILDSAVARYDRLHQEARDEAAAANEESFVAPDALALD